MYKVVRIWATLLLLAVLMSATAFASDLPPQAPDPDTSAVIELPTTPPESIDDTPITPEQRREAEEAIAAMTPPQESYTPEPATPSRERASIITGSHRKTVGIATEWVAVIGIVIATAITLVGIAGGRHGRKR